MKPFQVAYVPIGVPTFHMESANEQFHRSVELLKSLSPDCVVPEGPLLKLDDLKAYLDTLNADLVVLQNNTFANSAFATEVVKSCACPLVLWTLREPVIDGGRLRLNSLTGAFSAGNLMHHLGRPAFEYVFGAPGEDKVRKTLKAVIGAARVKKQLRGLTVASIGHTPQGFGFGRGLDADVTRAFGANLESVEARELMTKAKSYAATELTVEWEESRAKMVGLDKLPAENVEAYVRLYKAYKDFVVSKNVKALASRCWPDYFVDYGTPVCGVLGMLNDNLVAAACEADLYGAISMYIGLELSQTPVFFGDPVSLDEAANTVTFWHCGTAACSLARPQTGATMGVHPNRKIGPTMEFGCKPAEKATVFRVGRQPDGKFRFLVAPGSVLDAPQQFSGTSLVFQPRMNAEQFVTKAVKDGWEPHFVVIYADVVAELRALGAFLEMEVCDY